MELKDEQWTVLEPLIPKPHHRADGRGRPWRDDREDLNGMLWVLRTGAPWQDVPDRYPSPPTSHRRFQEWVRSRVFGEILHALGKDLRERGKLDLTECFIDATFVGARRGAFVWARRSSDPLAAQLAEGDVELIAPNRSNRKVKSQDGRPLRRYRRRWKIERLFAWLHNFRRLLTRWEYDVVNFLGFVQLGCIVILLRRCL